MCLKHLAGVSTDSGTDLCFVIRELLEARNSMFDILSVMFYTDYTNSYI
jgi:hypothetical protein